jgi:hypothetical protein
MRLASACNISGRALMGERQLLDPASNRCVAAPIPEISRCEGYEEEQLWAPGGLRKLKLRRGI